jgi:hypothetical protein
MQQTIPTLAAAALTFWALVGLTDHKPQPTPPQPRPVLVVPELRSEWQHPDPRTIARFPGP